MYDKDDIAAIQGFSNVTHVNKLQPIWAMFQNTKSVETHRGNVRREMKKWSDMHARQIERNLLFPKTSIDNFVGVKPNPGGSTAFLRSADKDVTILAC